MGKSNLKPETRWIPQWRRSCWWKFNLSLNFFYPKGLRFLFAFDARCLLWTSFNKWWVQIDKASTVFKHWIWKTFPEKVTNEISRTSNGFRHWSTEMALCTCVVFFFFNFFIPLTSISFLTLSPLFKTEIKRMSVFKNYEAGEPTCRLYVKNIAKQVEEKVGPAVARDPLSSILPDLFFVCVLSRTLTCISTGFFLQLFHFYQSQTVNLNLCFMWSNI